MNFLAFLVTAFLTISPTRGAAPFTPSITITVQDAFKGLACISIDVSETPQPDNIEFCIPMTLEKGETATVEFGLTGSKTGTSTFTGFLRHADGTIKQLNEVTVTVE